MANSRLRVLKRPSDFARIKDNGRRFQNSRWLILSAHPNETEDYRFGWTLSRKVGSAVMRNRLKRWCRQYFRQAIHANQKIGLDVHVLFRPMPAEFYKKLQHEEFLFNMDKAWKELSKHYRKDTSLTS